LLPDRQLPGDRTDMFRGLHVIELFKARDETLYQRLLVILN